MIATARITGLLIPIKIHFKRARKSKLHIRMLHLIATYHTQIHSVKYRI